MYTKSELTRSTLGLFYVSFHKELEIFRLFREFPGISNLKSYISELYHYIIEVFSL